MVTFFRIFAVSVIWANASEQEAVSKKTVEIPCFIVIACT